tara:strand:- start:1241 stop:1429 length:189 start_codon:yes stop_codon:yes gene_type:complete
MDTGKPRKKVTEDEVEVRTRFDATDIITFFLMTGPFWGALPLLLGLLGAWYFGKMSVGIWMY